jgi:hypothetical protein
MQTNEDIYKENDGYNIENSLAASVSFLYPNDEPNPERTFDISSHAIIIRFATLIFSADKPKLTLAALLYASGIDVGIYLSCKNTETDIANALGESKQNFSATVKRVRAEFNIERANTGKKESSKETYKQTNYRKSSYAQD